MTEQEEQKKKTLRAEVREKTTGYLTGALGLVAGLAWNDAIKGMIEYFYPNNGEGIGAKFIYAVIITIVVVTLSTYLVRLSERGKS